MPKLIYWVASCNQDSDCFSIIGTTRKKVVDQLAERGHPEDFDEPVQQQIEYKNAFDLFDKVTSTGAGRSNSGIPI